MPRILRNHYFRVILTVGYNYIWEAPRGWVPPTPLLDGYFGVGVKKVVSMVDIGVDKMKTGTQHVS